MDMGSGVSGVMQGCWGLWRDSGTFYQEMGWGLPAPLYPLSTFSSHPSPLPEALLSHSVCRACPGRRRVLQSSTPGGVGGSPQHEHQRIQYLS